MEIKKGEEILKRMLWKVTRMCENLGCGECPLRNNTGDCDSLIIQHKLKDELSKKNKCKECGREL